MSRWDLIQVGELEPLEELCSVCQDEYALKPGGCCTYCLEEDAERHAELQADIERWEEMRNNGE